MGKHLPPGDHRPARRQGFRRSRVGLVNDNAHHLPERCGSPSPTWRTVVLVAKGSACSDGLSSATASEKRDRQASQAGCINTVLTGDADQKSPLFVAADDLWASRMSSQASPDADPTLAGRRRRGDDHPRHLRSRALTLAKDNIAWRRRARDRHRLIRRRCRWPSWRPFELAGPSGFIYNLVGLPSPWGCCPWTLLRRRRRVVVGGGQVAWWQQGSARADLIESFMVIHDQRTT